MRDEDVEMKVFSGDLEWLRARVRERSDYVRTYAGSVDLLCAAVGYVQGRVFSVLSVPVDRAAVDRAVLEALPIVQWLLDEGADPNGVPSDGVPPVVRAACLPTTRILEALVGHGARLDARDRLGRDARRFANDPVVSAWLGEHWPKN